MKSRILALNAMAVAVTVVLASGRDHRTVTCTWDLGNCDVTLTLKHRGECTNPPTQPCDGSSGTGSCIEATLKIVCGSTTCEETCYVCGSESAPVSTLCEGWTFTATPVVNRQWGTVFTGGACSQVNVTMSDCS